MRLREKSTLLASVTLLLTACGSEREKPSQSPRQSGERPAKAILESMIQAYAQAPAYRDNAVLVDRYVSRSEGLVRESTPQLAAISFERPNRLRLVYRIAADDQGNVLERQIVSDGDRLRAAMTELPNQVLDREAPLVLSAATLQEDLNVRADWFSLPLDWLFPQLRLLVDAQASQQLADAEATRVEDAQHAGRDCFRIRLVGEDGPSVLWIDRQTYILRRYDLPSQTLKDQLDPQDTLKQLSMWVDFRDAAFAEEIPDEAFRMEFPESAVRVARFVTSHPGEQPSGSTVDPAAQEDYDRRLAAFYKELAEAAHEGQTLLIEVPTPQLAPRSEPEHFQLSEAWKAEGLTQPGGLMVIDNGSGKDGQRIFVIEGVDSVAELDTRGEQVAKHRLPLPAEEGISFLRTTTADGRRIFLASGESRRQVHLFDDQWQHLLSFPKGTHDGISDAVFCDLDGDRRPEFCVGYWGDVGVQGVSLAGRRQWSDRLAQVLELAVDPATTGRGAQLWCAYANGTIARYGNSGPLGDLRVGDRIIVAVAIADVDGDQLVERCGLAFSEMGLYHAVGIGEDGSELWNYELPKGEFAYAVERIIPARFEEDAGWFFPAADGSVHWLSKDGRPVDQFHYGAAITGMATTQLEDAKLLMISSSDGLSAWRLLKRSD